jgi:hypothetical protein
MSDDLMPAKLSPRAQSSSEASLNDRLKSAYFYGNLRVFCLWNALGSSNVLPL